MKQLLTNSLRIAHSLAALLLAMSLGICASCELEVEMEGEATGIELSPEAVRNRNSETVTNRTRATHVRFHRHPSHIPLLSRLPIGFFSEWAIHNGFGGPLIT